MKMKVQELILYSNNLTDTELFYSKILELDVINKSENQISFMIGTSVLTFKITSSTPTYHFAFNIPCNQIEEAVKWISNKIELIKINNPDVIVSFENWKAKSIYFFDNNNNIVELISKSDLENDCKNAFSKNSLLNINEVGIGTTNPETIYNLINKETNLPQYHKGPFREDFIAQGFEDCLFVISKNNRNWFPTNNLVQIHPLSVILKNDYRIYTLDFN